MNKKEGKKQEKNFICSINHDVNDAMNLQTTKKKKYDFWCSSHRMCVNVLVNENKRLYMKIDNGNLKGTLFAKLLSEIP